MDEGPALGVALLAGVGTGVYSSVAEACKVAIHDQDKTQVIEANAAQYRTIQAKYQRLYQHLKDEFGAA